MRFFKNRKSVVVIFILGFWLVYSLATVSIFYNSVDRMFVLDQQSRERKILYQSNLAMSFIVQDQIEVLEGFLKDAMEIDQFDFAILRDKNSPIFNVSRLKSIQIPDQEQPTDGVEQYGNFIFRTVKIDDLILTIGVFHEKSLFVKSYFQVYIWKLIFEILLVTGLAGALIVFVLRDVIQLSNLLKSSSKRDLNSIQPRSSEAQVFLSATESFEKLSQDLAKESQMFSSSLGSAITAELRRGTKAPSSFSAVLVRVDLNSYTQKYLSTDLKQMTVTLNQYFAVAREIIERHQGLIYEYIGDEIVFFFQQTSSHEETLLRAGNCVRDLFAEVATLRLSEFTLKASLCSGILHFVKLDQGPAFSGVPLIQSARMLSYISNKNISSLIVLNSDLSSLESIVDQKNTLFGELKGFEGQFQLTEISGFHPMAQPNPTFYRSSNDLADCFHVLKDLLSDQDSSQSRSLMEKLRWVHVQSRAQKISSEYLSALRVIVSNPFDLKVLSMMVSLSKNFVPLSEYGQELKGLLLQVEQMKDPRTRANALLARAHFEADLDVHIERIDKSSNRLLADALFVLGRKAVDARLLREIEALATHRDQIFRASGLYLASALLRFHQERDAVYFNTNPCFDRLKEILKESLDLSDPNLKKHALAYQEMSGAKL